MNRAQRSLPVQGLCSVQLYPVERLVGYFLIFAIALYTLIDIPLRSPFSLYWRKVSFAMVTYLLGLLIAIFLQRLADIQEGRRNTNPVSWSATLARYRQRFWGAGFTMRNIRCLHAVGLMFAVYINLKHLIPFVNADLYDAMLASVEASLFGGRSPTEHFIRFFGAANAPLLSSGYTLFYPYVAVLTVCIVLQANTQDVRELTSGFVLLWFLAIILEYAIPTWGPCFSQPELIAQLPTTEVSELQQGLLRQKDYVLQHPQSPIGVFLISGLPSLHFAVVLWGSLALGKMNRWVARLSWIFCGLTFITTLYFGWHFVADLFAAALLVVIVWYVAPLLDGKSNAADH